MGNQTGTGFLEANHELLFKLIKTDGKLVRLILETNGF